MDFKMTILEKNVLRKPLTAIWHANIDTIQRAMTLRTYRRLFINVSVPKR